MFNIKLSVQDCPPPCLNSVLEDYRAAGGVCSNSFLDINWPGVFNTSTAPCVFYEPGDILPEDM